MKVAILAGGVGSRIQEETEVRPKPMVEIGGQPILWHIMKHYAPHGFNDFVVALGYKGDYIKRYIVDYALARRATSRVDIGDGRRRGARDGDRDDWKVALVDTGQTTNKGGRIKRLAPYLGDEHVHDDLGRRRLRRRPQPAARVPPRARQAGDGDRGPPAGALRPHRARGRRRHRVLGEAADPRGLDQRRVLRARAAGARLHRRRRRPSGSGSRSSGSPPTGS